MFRANGILILLTVLMSCSGMKEHDKLILQVVSLTTPADSLTEGPHLFTSGDGTVLLSWVEERNDSARFWFSRLNGEQWSDPTLIANGTDWFVNWADYPMIASEGDNVVAHVLSKSAKGTYTYDVIMYTSTEGGASWKQPFLLHDDGKQAEHGFVSLVPFGDKVFVSWLDGRNTVMEGMEGMENMDHSGHHGAMSLRAAIMDYEGKKSGEWELDNKVCDCCQTTAAITTNGPIVIYRDRSDAEVRDMSIARFVDGQWTQPVTIHSDNWKIAGCPVNGPRVSVDGNRVAVAWFSAAKEPAHVNVIFSEDGGASFGEAFPIDDGMPIGRVDIAWLDEERCMVSWMEGSQIRAAVVHTDGARELPTTIAESSDARSSGFPQMTRSGDRLIFAWTDDRLKRVQTASVTLEQ